jgi:hypothetical protein
MPGILCCFGHTQSNGAQRGNGLAGTKEVPQAANESPPPFLVTVSTKPDAQKDATVYTGPHSGQLRVPSPAVSPNQPVDSALAGGRAADLAQGLLQVGA